MSQIEELREILVGGNAQEIAELRDRLENLDKRTRDVAEVLAPAINSGIKKNDALLEAFKDPVSRSLKSAIRTEPDSYAEILYPVMAPAIRRSISQAISSLLVTINQTIASATSTEGIQLRLEAYRTGVPYAQLVLKRSLIFRVEHIYLIERESGMMVTELSTTQGSVLDSDAVSAMFTAIQSFVQDSFSQSADDRLTALKVGEHSVWVAHGSKLMLACVISGDPPEQLKFDMYDTLDGVHADYAPAIEAFDGDSSEFGNIEVRLLPLMQARLREQKQAQKKSNEEGAGEAPMGFKMGLMLIVAGVVIVFLLARWGITTQQRSAAEHYLTQTPGISPSAVYWNDGKIVVEGLRDPESRVPFELLAAHNLHPEDFNFVTVPFRSLQPEMEIQRFRDELAPPAGVSLTAQEVGVALFGEAPLVWLLEKDQRLRQLAMDRRLDYSDLKANSVSVRDYIIAHHSDATPRRQQQLLETIGADSWASVSVQQLADIR